MNGNATFRHRDTAVLSVIAIDAPEVKTSEEFDAIIGDSYRRNGLRPGMLAKLAGIEERRWWPEGHSFVEGAIEAGRRITVHGAFAYITSRIEWMTSSPPVPRIAAPRMALVSASTAIFMNP